MYTSVQHYGIAQFCCRKFNETRATGWLLWHSDFTKFNLFIKHYSVTSGYPRRYGFLVRGVYVFVCLSIFPHDISNIDEAIGSQRLT